jgi:hypothetical protein
LLYITQRDRTQQGKEDSSRLLLIRIVFAGGLPTMPCHAMHADSPWSPAFERPQPGKSGQPPSMRWIQSQPRTPRPASSRKAAGGCRSANDRERRKRPGSWAGEWIDQGGANLGKAQLREMCAIGECMGGHKLHRLTLETTREIGGAARRFA